MCTYECKWSLHVCQSRRTARVFLFSALAASAGLGLGTACIRSLASFLNAPNAAPLLDNLSDVGVDLIALVVCLYLRQRDVDARNKALERLEREETIGALLVTIGVEEKRSVRKLKDLRSFARPVIIASTSPEDLALAVDEAAENSKQLVERGVVLVPVLLAQSTTSTAYAEMADEWRNVLRKYASNDDEKSLASRVIAIPSQLFAWREWFTTQMAQAQSTSGNNSDDKKCVYISLRLDGRVRASGKNRPSLVGLSMSLPSQNWKGMLDGFDGSVNPLQ